MAPPCRWELSLPAWGWEGASQTVTPATISIQENLIEYQRNGHVEWYRNDQDGLEQRLAIERGTGSPSPSALVLELTLSSDLTPWLAPDGSAIKFLAQDGLPVLRYASLRANDAAG